MSESGVKPSTHKLYTTIQKLSSPVKDSNWDTWLFAMWMLLRGKNLKYVVEGGYKEGFNGTEQTSCQMQIRRPKIVWFLQSLLVGFTKRTLWSLFLVRRARSTYGALYLLLDKTTQQVVFICSLKRWWLLKLSLMKTYQKSLVQWMLFDKDYWTFALMGRSQWKISTFHLSCMLCLSHGPW